MARSEHGRHERDDLTGEHALTDIGQLILAVAFAAVWIADTFFLRLTTFLNAHVPLAVRIPVGVTILVGAACLARSSHRIIFGQRRAEPRVVREGVFAWVRHPMYLSELLLYAGLWAISLSWMAAGVGALAGAFLHTVARHEERLLLERFGDEYARTMREVPMWLPRPRRKP